MLKETSSSLLMRPKLAILISFMLHVCALHAQPDSSVAAIQNISSRYLVQTGKKIDRYQSRITHKTEKTLERLSGWENKLKRTLQKTYPSAAEKLFAPGRPSFKQMLEEYRQGKIKTGKYKTSYDAYTDELNSRLLYLDSNKNLFAKEKQQLIGAGHAKLEDLRNEEGQTETLQKMIKKRKQELMEVALTQLGKNKQLQKINKEAYYYTETLKNYKQLFKDKNKREEAAKKILEEIPGFNDFVRRNSMLASLFRMPGNDNNSQSLAGLQTRASVNAMIQDRIGAGGPGAREQVQQNIQQAQAELDKLKNKILKAGGGNTGTELPDFKPNSQRSKTFAQRLEYGFNLQFGKRTSMLPGTADIGITAGYKLNDKSSVGIGAGYKLGMGSIQKIRFSHEGVSLRSYLDWKLKKQFFVSGGFEMNHHASFKDFGSLGKSDAWQQSGLLGISKKMPLKTKFSKGTKLQLLYDFLHRQHLPVSQPVIFRVGYDLK